MPESLVQVTSGAGPKLHTWQRTIGANNVEDEFVIPGEFPYPSYTVVANAVAAGTANAHLLAINAGASSPVRVRRIWIEQQANATTAALWDLRLYRTTTAPSGGTAITPAKLDPSDAAAGATAMTLPTVKGTESDQLRATILIARQAFSATAAGQIDEPCEWTFGDHATKPLVIPAGAANGIAIKTVSAIVGATVTIYVELSELGF